jgi:hypothetical protein
MAGVTSVVKYVAKQELLFPVSGAGANIPIGTLMMPGVTAGTNDGVLIPVTATSNANAIGVLNTQHNYASSGDALTTTLTQWFPLAGFNGASYLFGNIVGSTATAPPYPSHPIELIDASVLVRVSYNLASTMAVASFNSGTQVATITNEITTKDSAFDYFNAGTAIGELAFVTVSNSGSDTFVTGTPLTVSPDSTTKITQILPLFYRTPVWKVNSTTVCTLLDSTAAVGTGRAIFIANFIGLNGDSFQLDPYTFHNKQGLNLVTNLDFFSYVQMQSSGFHPVS